MQKGTITPVVSFTTPAHPEEVAVRTPSEITGSSVHLEGSLVAHEQETQWHFEYASAGEAEAEHWAAGPSGSIPAAVGDNSPHEVEADLAGLASATVYYVRLFAENPYGQSTSSRYVGFQTPAPATVKTFLTHAIHGESLRLLGSVSTSVVPGDTTRYHFEYVGKAKFEESGFAGATATPEVGLEGDQSEKQSIEVDGHTVEVTLPRTEIVGQDLPELKLGESYEYRLVAENDEGATQGVAQTLATPSIGGSGSEETCPNEALRAGASGALPACRAYEQVTPVDKQGATDIFTWSAEGISEHALASQDGEHVFFSATVNKTGANSAVLGGGSFFSRVGEGRWRMTSGTPQPETGFEEYELGNGGGLFNADLTEVGLTSGWLTGAAKSPELTYKVGSPGGPYTTVASVPTGVAQSNRWAGASADFGTLVLKTADHKLLGKSTPTISDPGRGSGSGLDLYEYSGGELRQLNVDSEGKTIGTCGARLALGNQGAEEGSGIHAISADGSRIFFNASPTSTCPGGDEEEFGGPNWHLYMRLNGSSTVDIGEYRFLGANADGSRLLLARKGAANVEFFLYDTATRAAKHLSSLVSFPDGPLFDGPFVSEDLSTMYLVGGGSTSETPGGEYSPLYTYDVGTETLHFALAISIQSSHTTTNKDGPFMSPDGRYFYWNSAGNPAIPHPEKTLDENGKVTQRASSQLYRYDRIENVVECVSCASPYDPEPLLEAVTEAAANQDGENSVNNAPTIRIASDDGDHVFFVTAAALVPQDLNGEVPFGNEVHEGFGSPSFDVYEWRKPGVDGCARIQGCIALISGGREGQRNTLIGTTPSGRDVFFATHEELVAKDTDTAGDIYDARIDGGEPPPAQRSVECEGDACATPFTAPSDVTPSSSTFQGAGNVLAGAASGETAKHVAKKPKKKRVVKNKRKGRSSRAKRPAHAHRRSRK
jgi:hypothetical protein